MQYKTIGMLCATVGFAVSSEVTTGTIDPAFESLATFFPTWVEEAIETARPTAWLSSMIYDTAFAYSVVLEEVAGTMPAWYNNLPVSVLEFFSHRDAVMASYLGVDLATTTQSDTFTSSGSFATATTTTATTAVETGSSNTHPISVSTSTSTGGSPAATGALYMSLAGAAGILGFSLAL
ncbi:hypothetical protein N7540_000175 [Penicillium herquei]|nr:hypothetical protein N7540_000175 [Penicillium herquei]